MWQPGETVVWRGIFRNRVWHAQTVFVVKDTVDEIVVTLLPGTECAAEANYPKGKEASERWWAFKDRDWQLTSYTWQTNRLLFLLEPQKYYSTILFWTQVSSKFVCYYINFQLPFRRGDNTIDTLDLDLDLIVYPDLSFRWKDVEDYQKAGEAGAILPEWVAAIDQAKQEVLDKLVNRQYPFDGSWLDWTPDSSLSPPKLPVNWDKI